MSTDKILKYLHDEMPGWKTRGWLNDENAEALLGHAEQQRKSAGLPFSALAVLGAILLGTGCIMYVAANWREWGSLANLVILLSVVYASYLTGGYLKLSRAAPGVAGACFLLGVIAFGASVALVAQIYHMDADYQTGILLFASLGGLLTAYLLRTQSVLILTVALALLWSCFEVSGLGLTSGMQEHTPAWYLPLWYLPVCCVFLPAIYRWQWRLALHIVLLSLVIWLVVVGLNIEVYWGEGGGIYILHLYFFIGASLLIAGPLLRSYPRLEGFSGLVQAYGIYIAFFSLYILTVPYVQDHDVNIRPTIAVSSLVSVAVAFLVWCGLGAWCRMRLDTEARTRTRAGYMLYGYGLMGITTVVLFVNFIIGPKEWLAIVFSLLFFSGTVWMVFAGARANHRFMVNSGFLFFALGVISFYTIRFWALQNSALFFVGGGILLLLGVFFLESQRRRIMAQLTG